MARNIAGVPVSKEYGAWASLATTFFAGAGVAGQINLEALILFVGALSFFLARTPLLGVLRSINSRDSQASVTEHWRTSRHMLWMAAWFTIYSLFGIGSFALLLFKYNRTGLYIFILLSSLVFLYNIYNTFNKGTRARQSSISGVLGVSLLSSFTYYVATGYLDKTVATLWLLVFLYLAGGVFYVETRLGVFKWRACLVFHIVTTLVVSTLAITRAIPMLALVAYYPAFIKSSVGALSPKKEAIPKKLGRAEILYSLIFIVIIILVYRVRF